jgi:hypothetical protein
VSAALVGKYMAAELLCAESVCDKRLAVELVCRIEGLVRAGLEGSEGGVEFAGDDLFSGSGGIAEFAGGEVAVFGARRRTEGSAENRAIVVEIAGACGEIEDGAGFIVGELFEEFGGLLIFAQDAEGGDVAGVASSWKPRIEAGEGVGDSFFESLRSGWVGLGEGLETFAEACCVLLRDGKDSDAALRATGTADEMRAAAQSGGCECGVDDLDEVLLHWNQWQ